MKINTSKFTLTLLLLLGCGGFFTLSAQDTLFFEDFEGTPTSFTLNTTDLGGNPGGFNDWVINSTYVGGSGTLICLGFPFTFTVANTPPQPMTISNANGNYLHLLADEAANDNVLNANYQPADGTCQGAESNFARMTNDVNTVGRTNVTLTFWWIGAMSSFSIGELHYSTNGGTSWTQVTAPISSYFGQVSWIQQTVTNPAFDNQPTLRFGFRFVNNISTTGADPAFSIDDVTITAAPGCSPTTTNASASICDGDSLFVGGGFQTSSGLYTDSLTDNGGCDSIIITDLTVNPSPVIIGGAIICDGDSLFVGGAFQTTSGVYTDVFTTPAGCDSTVETTLTVLPSSQSSASASICQGDSLFVGGAFQTTAGTYTDVLTAGNGCDSTVTTTLTVLAPASASVNDTICSGDSILVGGAFQTTAGVYVDTLSTTAGCDSIVTTELAVSNVDNAVTNNSGVLIAIQNGATYQWIDCISGQPIAGQTGQTFAITSTGSFAVDVTLNGCTIRSECIDITLGIGSRNTLGTTVEAFPNPVGQVLKLEFGKVMWELEVEIVDLQGRVLQTSQWKGQRYLQLDMGDLAPGVYSVRVRGEDGSAVLKIVKL